MAFKLFKELKVVTGRYINDVGDTRCNYAKIGVLLKDTDTDKFLVKLETIPMGQVDKDGIISCWISCFDPYDPATQGTNFGQAGFYDKKKKEKKKKKKSTNKDVADTKDDTWNVEDDVPF